MHYTVTLKTSEQDRPRDHEMSAAILLAEHFECNVIFLRPGRQRTPDVEVNGVKWEIKSPLGKSKHTIEEQVKRASAQSLYIIIDARRCKLHMAKIRNHLKFQISVRPKINRVLLINKRGGVEIIK